MTEMSVRALRPADVDAARALLSRQFAGTPYEARLLAQLESAIRGDDPECRAHMTDDAHGLVLFGSIAGAAGVVKVHALAGDEASLLYALVLEVLAAGARLVICEIPDDAPFAMTGRVCRELGFDAEGRVADYFRDGVALLVLTWRSL